MSGRFDVWDFAGLPFVGDDAQLSLNALLSWPLWGDAQGYSLPSITLRDGNVCVTQEDFDMAVAK